MDMSKWSQLVEVEFPANTEDTYCVDTIKDFWNEKRKEIITRLKSRDHVVALDFCPLQHGAWKYKDSGVIHSLDMWHGAKNLGKKIIAAGQQRGQAVLLQWAKDICNHFWYCCKMADNYSQFIIMWTGLLHHVTNEHTWSLGACLHEPLEDDTNREWIKKESSVHITLIQIDLNKRWLTDVHKYLTFRSTSELESFNNHIRMYASKRSSFSPPVYEARTLLAALDYNYHVYRTAKRNSQGAYMYHKIYNKKSRRWNLYTIKSEKTYHYIRDLQSAILETRLQSTRACQGPVNSVLMTQGDLVPCQVSHPQPPRSCCRLKLAEVQVCT
ncbi:hypothetical protein UPYG_G00319610 [Umbra pygmaea]|uniref:Transposase n=1 Tax=Umbra pygmaea TaxID=75934 RepID=A0ABD0W076_UMBPY